MPPSASLSDTGFTVLCVKTVNDLEANSEVVEVACVKIRQGRIDETLHMQFNPQTPLPEEFTRKTGLYTQALKAMPLLESVLPELSAFVGRDVVIWTHQPGKTNSVHRYFKLTQPREKQLFLSVLAPKALPNLSRHGLSYWAQHYGVESEQCTRAEQAAIVSAKVFLNILTTLKKEHGIDSFDQFLDFCPAQPSRKRVTRKDLAFDRDRLKHYPTQPGVYFMKNRLGEILYVGKAKNLRNRLRSYFQKQSQLPPKIAAMMRQVAMIEVNVVGSELEALILESRLIKQHQPFFNKKVKDFQRMVFLKVSVNADYPQVSIAVDTEDPQAAYFGPFHGKSSLMAKLELLNRTFQLRDCPDKKFNEHRQSACMQAHIGLCSGPCANLINQEDYRERVADFLRFLQQDPSYVVEGLLAKRNAYVEALEFEKAALLQEQLDLLERLQLNSYSLIQAVEEHYCLLVLPAAEAGAVRLLSVLQGQPNQWKTFYPQQDAWDELETWLKRELSTLNQLKNKARQAIPKAFYEETRLISQWLTRREANEGQVIPLANKSARQVRDELLLILDANPDALLPTDAPDAELESWDWEREAQG